MNIPEGWKLVPADPTEEMIAVPLIREVTETENLYDGIYKSMLAAAPTPPTPEVEPVGHIHRIELSEMVSVGVNLTATGEMLPNGTNLYTHPDNDGLRKAAEEALLALDERGFLNGLSIRAVENLRAALNK